MTGKVLFYNGIEDFTKELYRLRLPEALVQETIAHERAHLNKARELGYRADYCINFPDGDINNFIPAVHVYKGQNLSNEDLTKILLATDDPSERDVERLKSLEALK